MNWNADWGAGWDAGWQGESGPGFPSVALSGTIVGGINETQLINGGLTIIQTLTNETWVATGAVFDAQRQNILDGWVSAQNEINGWNNRIRDAELVTAVVRVSDSIVIITLSPAPNFDISLSEVITGIAPGSALVGGGDLVASPLITINRAKGMQAVNGRRPQTRKISAKSISIALSGAEKAYPVYQFSRKQFVERPGHKPFEGL